MEHRIHQPGPWVRGINKVVDINGPHRDYLMDFEILNMKTGDTYKNSESYERVYLLINGKLELKFEDRVEIIDRPNYYDHLPYALQLAPDTEVIITCLEDAEVSIWKTENDIIKHNILRTPKDVRVERRGVGVMDEAGARTVRTIIDKSIDESSNFVIGEDMHYPGKWSGFPSHWHPQPEIYFYKFHPAEKEGFGLIRLGDDAKLIQENDTILIEPGLVHPQVGAPAYAMYYIWTIRHLEGNPYIKPVFLEEYDWCEKSDAVMWTDQK